MFPMLELPSSFWGRVGDGAIPNSRKFLIDSIKRPMYFELLINIHQRLPPNPPNGSASKKIRK